MTFRNRAELQPSHYLIQTHLLSPAPIYAMETKDFQSELHCWHESLGRLGEILAFRLDGNKTVPFRTAHYAKMMYLDELHYFLPKSKWA